MDQVRKQRVRTTAGFSLIELMIAVAIIFIVMAMALVSMQGILPTLRANAAMNSVRNTLRLARETAIAERRNVQVQFIAPSRIVVTRIDLPAGTTVINDVTLEGDMRFQLYAGVPDLPDAFGNATAISFGGAGNMLFLSDGTFVDGQGNPLNGTVFLGSSVATGDTNARAISVVGATGRIRSYRWNGGTWLE